MRMRRTRRRRGMARVIFMFSPASGSGASANGAAPAPRCVLATVEPPLKLAHDPPEMAVHRRAGTVRVPVGDRAQDGGVIADRLVGELVGIDRKSTRLNSSHP